MKPILFAVGLLISSASFAVAKHPDGSITFSAAEVAALIDKVDGQTAAIEERDKIIIKYDNFVQELISEIERLRSLKNM